MSDIIYSDTDSIVDANSDELADDFWTSAKEGTLKVLYKGLSINADGVATQEDGAEAEVELILSNYNIVLFDYFNGRIWLVPVKGAGSDYQPKCSMTCGEWTNKELRSTIIYGYQMQPIVNTLKTKWANEKGVELLDDFATGWGEIFDANPTVYYMDIPLPGSIVKKWGTATINDVTGEGIIISPYGMWEFCEKPNDIEFMDATTTESRDYVYGNWGTDTTYVLPEERMSADTDGIYGWLYFNTVQQYNLYTSADYTGKVNYWADGYVSLQCLMVQIAVGWNLDNLNAGLKRYHKFKGIQWDVWLDGDGKATTITIVQTPNGEMPERFFGVVGFANTAVGTEFFDAVGTMIITQSEFTESRLYYFNLLKDFGGGEILQSYDLGMVFYIVDTTSNEPIALLPHSARGRFIIPESLPDSADDIPIVYNDYDDKLEIDIKIVIHIGLYDGDKYDEPDVDDDDIEDSEGYNGVGLLTKQYAMTSERCQQLGYNLWEANFIENIKLVNNNPIENVIGLKVYPFDITGNTEEIILGNVPMNTNGERIEEFNNKQEIGSIKIEGRYGSFLDFAPFTKITIWLPFIGFKDLDVSACMYKRLTVTYIRDIITGACKADLKLNGKPWQTFDGEMGIDINLMSSNRAQVEAAFVANTVSSVTRNVGSIAGGASKAGNNNAITAASGKAKMIQGIANIGSDLLQSALNQYHTTSGGSPSPSCAAYQTRDVFLIYDYPSYQELKDFNKTFGRMCMLGRTIGGLTGFTKTTAAVNVGGIPCTVDERQEIISILSSGFFV